MNEPNEQDSMTMNSMELIINNSNSDGVMRQCCISDEWFLKATKKLELWSRHLLKDSFTSVIKMKKIIIFQLWIKLTIIQECGNAQVQLKAL